jgi:hypothetical protein
MGRAHRSDPVNTLTQAVRSTRILAVAGLPGVGKSLLVREAATLADGAGRRVHFLRWDSARLAFNADPYPNLYPEIADVTHPVIRRAAGVWARAAIGRWWDRTTAKDVLLAEVPLFGNRFLELATSEADEIEALLCSPLCRFLVVVPSMEVRQLVSRARERDYSAPKSADERNSAAPDLVEAQWAELVDAAGRLGMATADPTRYDPEVYWRVYQRILRHRHCERLSVDCLVAPSGRPLADRPHDVVPTAAEVHQVLALVERMPAEAVVEQVEGWATRI